MQHLSSNKAEFMKFWRKHSAPERTDEDEGERTMKTGNIPFINTNTIQSHNKTKTNEQTKSQSSVPYAYINIVQFSLF